MASIPAHAQAQEILLCRRTGTIYTLHNIRITDRSMVRVDVNVTGTAFCGKMFLDSCVLAPTAQSIDYMEAECASTNGSEKFGFCAVVLTA